LVGVVFALSLAAWFMLKTPFFLNLNDFMYLAGISGVLCLGICCAFLR
jgi:hypothetical protein